MSALLTPAARTARPATPLQYAQEPFTAWMDEGAPLFEAHWREVQHDHHAIDLAPDFAHLIALEKAGCLAGFSARHARPGSSMPGRLAGYALFLLHTPLHFRQHRFAQCAVIYIDPDAGRGQGLGFIRHCEQVLRGQGVSKIMIGVTRARDFGPVLSYLGYAPGETIYERLLIEPASAAAPVTEPWIPTEREARH